MPPTRRRGYVSEFRGNDTFYNAAKRDYGSPQDRSKSLIVPRPTG